MMKIGSEFFLSAPHLIRSISNMNVYRKTSKTLLRLSNSKRKIKSATRFLYYLNIYLDLIYHFHVSIGADRITEVMSNLQEALNNDKISNEESPSIADVGSPQLLILPQCMIGCEIQA